MKFPHYIMCVFIMFLAAPATAGGSKAGRFDYYLLSLSWSPGWCAREGTARNSPQCAPGKEFSFVLHGLWPQYEKGWPENCHTDARAPTRSETDAMADIMGTAGLAWHEWLHHGRCTGLNARDYFALSRRARDSITIPQMFRDLRQDITLPAQSLEDAFLKANPQLARDNVTVICRDGAISEVRICLDRALKPRTCAPDTIRDCTLGNARMTGRP